MRDKLLFAFIMVALAGGSPSFQAGVGPSLDHEDGEATLPVTLWTTHRLLRLPPPRGCGEYRTRFLISRQKEGRGIAKNARLRGISGQARFIYALQDGIYWARSWLITWLM